MYTSLISAPQLAAIIGQSVRILDCRARLGDAEFGSRAYAGGHISGAIRADLDRDLAAAPGVGGRHPLPDRETLAARAQSWGINDEDQVVVYDDASGAFAARAWWCLRWLGHEATALLDGGLGAWKQPLTADATTIVPGNFSIRACLTRTIDAATLADQLSEHELVDARTAERFNGEQEPIDPVAGHIPGASCLPFQDNLEANGQFKPASDLGARFAALSDDVICYCGSGVSAAHNVLAMRIAGRAEPILYPGSWSEWIVDPARPRAP
ncbi:MAG: sulfurtransferase [Gammaproteobacteria bacterium]|nr:sulfurtransferase [Gammaproteobacteria bacterium]